MNRRLSVLISLLFIAGCTGTGSGTLAPTPTPTPAPQHLYVTNDQSPGGVRQYTLPITSSSTANFTIAGNSDTTAALDTSGDMLLGDNAGLLNFFTAPLSATSVPAATFTNGAATNNGQVVFTSAGDLFAATAAASVNMFTHPFSNASVPSATITAPGFTSVTGTALDSAGNLYVSNASAGSTISVFAPPYTGAPVTTPLVAGEAYRKIALTSTQLFATAVSPGTGQVDVFTLPITAASTPAFSITNGTNVPEAIAVDANGNLYVGNLGNGSVTVYAPPFSAASAPAVTLTIGGTFAIFGVAVGK